MEEITVYKFWHNGSAIIDQSFKGIINSIEAEAEYFFEDDDNKEFELKIEKIKMTVDEYENLPEFDGF